MLNDTNNIYGSPFMPFVRVYFKKNTIELENQVVARTINFLGLLFNDTYF
jgi:hypothetical protein